MDDEASPDPSTAPAVRVPAVPDDDSPAETAALTPQIERRLRRLSGRQAPYRGPIVATTRGWVSRDSRHPLFAARFLDFAVLTEEHLVLCSTGFFSRRPRRQVLREPFTRLVVTPAGGDPVRTLRIAGDFSRAIRFELRGDDAAAFARELMVRAAADPRRRAEPWATTGQLGIEPSFTEKTAPQLPAGNPEPEDVEPDTVDDPASDEHTAPS